MQSCLTQHNEFYLVLSFYIFVTIHQTYAVLKESLKLFLHDKI